MTAPGEELARALRFKRMRHARRIVFAAVALALGFLALASPPFAARRGGSASVCADAELRVYKRQGELDLVCAGTVVRTVGATFGASPAGAKEQEGDERTPEGTYTLTSKTKSDRFHRFLAVSYPNDEDRRRAKESGITRIGGGIGIHGVRRDLAGPVRAWTRVARATGLAGVWGPTDGCIAVTNEDVEILYDAASVGTPVTIAPSR